MNINFSISVVATSKATYDKDAKEFSAEISSFLEEVDYGNGLKNSVMKTEFFSPLFSNNSNVVGFWLKSNKTGTKILMKLQSVIREDGDILYWVFVPAFTEDRNTFNKFILFND